MTTPFLYAQVANVDPSLGWVQIDDYCPSISQNDIQTGYFIRYFLRQVNYTKGDITEISPSAAIALASNNMYIIIEVEWKIVGNKQDVINANTQSVNNAEIELPGMKQQLLNFIQFWTGS